MPRSLFVALALAVLSLAVVTPAHAYLLTVNFQVATDPTDGTFGSITRGGSFSFDSSIIPVGAGSLFGSHVPDTNPTWDQPLLIDTPWAATTSTLDLLVFDASGNLTDFRWFGGSTLGFDPGPDFIVRGSTDPLDNYFSYRGSTSAGHTGSIVSFTVTKSGEAPVPEPGMLALVAPGLLALGMMRRRKR